MGNPARELLKLLKTYVPKVNKKHQLLRLFFGLASAVEFSFTSALYPLSESDRIRDNSSCSGLFFDFDYSLWTVPSRFR